MKQSVFSFLFSCVALGLTMRVGGHALGFSDVVSIVFAAGLAGWIIEIYSRETRALVRFRPLHLPMAGNLAKRSLGISSRKAA